MSEQDDIFTEIEESDEAGAEQLDITNDTDATSGNDEHTETAEDKEAARQKAAEGQIRKAQKLLDEGKELPKDLQWTAKHLTAKPQQKAEVNEDALLEKLEQRLRDQQIFTQTKSELESLELSPEDKKALKAEFEELKSAGIPAGKALQKAVKIVGFASRLEQAQAQSAMANMALTPGKAKPFTQKQKDILELSGEDFDKAWDAMVKRK